MSELDDLRNQLELLRNEYDELFDSMNRDKADLDAKLARLETELKKSE